MNHGLAAGNEVDVWRTTNMPGGLGCKEGDNSEKTVGIILSKSLLAKPRAWISMHWEVIKGF